jgi:hypothetical protein
MIGIAARRREMAGDLLDPHHGPNAVTSAAHDRMPVILDADSYDLWLDPGMRDATAASDLLRPHARLMRCYPSASNVLRTREALGVNATDDCSVPATRAR